MEFTLTTYVDGLILAGLTEHVAAGNYSGPLYGAMVALSTAAPTPSPKLTIADMTEATFGGYAEKALTPFGTSFTDSNGNEKELSPVIQFEATDSVTPQTALAVYITDGGAPAKLLAYGVLPSGVNFAAAGDALNMVIEVSVGESLTVTGTILI